MANAGDSVNASNFNALFTRLEALRAKHYARPDVTDSALASSWTGPAVAGNPVVPSNIQSAKDKIVALENAVNNISGYSSTITVPSVGALLQASTITLVETALSGMEGICANNTNNSNFSVNGFNANDSAFPNDGVNGYNCATCFSNWGSNCSWF